MATLTAGPSGINMSLPSFFVPIIEVNSFTSTTITDTIQNGNTEVWTGYFLYGNGQLIGGYASAYQQYFAGTNTLVYSISNSYLPYNVYLADESANNIAALEKYVLPTGSTYFGSSGFDVLVGQNGNDTFVGGSGTETFIPAGGSNTIIGGAGVDTVQFNGPSTNYVITQNGNGSVSVTNATVTDHLSNVGYLQFSDKTVVVNAPTITGTVAGQTTVSEAALEPFATVTISDANTQASEELTITIGGSGGTLSGTGLTGGAGGVYALSGSPMTVTSELDALSFTPKAGATNTSSVTTFTLSDKSSAYTAPTINNATTVIDNDVGVAPIITGAVASQTTTSEASVKLFSGVTITDLNSNATDTLTITVGGSGGTLSGAGLTGGAGGVYTLRGDAATVTSELDALSFTPNAGTPNTSSTTTFTISDQSSAYTTPTINTTTSVIDHDGASAPKTNFITLVNFEGGSDGSFPTGGLVADLAGDLFGMASGTNGAVTIFEIAKTATGYAGNPVQVLSIPGYPEAGLVTDQAGDLFGTTGSVNGTFGVFEIAKTTTGFAGSPTTLVANQYSSFGPYYSGLTSDQAGDLFGTSYYITDAVFTTNDNVFEIVKTPTAYAGAATYLAYPGYGPIYGLTLDQTGDLFGGMGNGAVFEIAKTATGYASTPITLATLNGAPPVVSLILDQAGDLIGTTSAGGAFGDGTVFEIAKTATGYASTPITLVSFSGANGSTPVVGALIADQAGDLIGTTAAGGTNGDGTVFEIAKTATGYASVPVTLVNFNGTNGSTPVGGLVLDQAGNIFGTTNGGGVNGDGTVFELSGTGFVTGTVVSNPTNSQETLVAPLANTLVQGGGYDILNLSQNPIATASSAYTETSNDNGTFNLTTGGSIDVVSGIMQIQFSDKTVTVAANGSENEFIALLYQGALGRTPDAAGLAGWEQIGAALPSTTTQSLGLAYGLSDTSGGYNGSLSIAAGFTQSAEFIADYGTLTNQQFVTQLYANILDRAPDTAGFNSWVSQLNSGVSREHVLVGFADSQEAINNATLGFVGQSGGVHAAWLFLT